MLLDVKTPLDEMPAMPPTAVVLVQQDLVSTIAPTDDDAPPPYAVAVAHPHPAKPRRTSTFLSKLIPRRRSSTPSVVPCPDPTAHLRTAPPDLSYPRFDTFSMDAAGRHLEHGFKRPGPTLANHNVFEADWDRFIKDVQATARISTTKRVFATVLPIALLHIPGIFVAHAVLRRMRIKKIAPAASIVDNWNENFFKSRKIEVVLYHGHKRLSGARNASQAEKSPTLANYSTAPEFIVSAKPETRARTALKRTSSKESSSSTITSPSASAIAVGRRTLPCRCAKREKHSSKSDRVERRARKAERRAKKCEMRSEKRQDRRERKSRRRAERRMRRDARRGGRFRIEVVSLT